MNWLRKQARAEATRGYESRLGLSVALGSSVGMRRLNQDRAIACGNIVALADGVGGGPLGELAAQTALGRVMIDAATLDPALAGDIALPLLTKVAHSQVVTSASQRGVTDAGCTLSLAHFERTRTGVLLTISWVGDSPMWLLSDGNLKRLTPPRDPRLRVPLDGAIGWPTEPMPSVLSMTVAPGDRLLIASDGLEPVPERAIRRLCGQDPDDAWRCVDRLLREAAEWLAQDNVTLAVVDIREDASCSLSEVLVETSRDLPDE